MKPTFLFLLIACFGLTACGSKISNSLQKTYPALPSDTPVKLLGLESKRPEGSELLGTIKFGDSGFSTDCGYAKVVSLAEQQARRAGGNVLRIIQHKTPSVFRSSCHRMTFEVLKTDAASLDSIPRPAAAEVQSVMSKPPMVFPENYQPMRFALNAGYSQRTAKIVEGISSQERDYLKNLRRGYFVDAALVYFGKKIYGFGAKYIYNNSQHSIANGLVGNDITIQYFGPTVGLQAFQGKNRLFLDLSVGYLGYRDKYSDPTESSTLKGATMGSSLDIDYDFKVSKGLYLGLHLGLNGGGLSRFTLIDQNGREETIELPDGQTEGLSRIDIGAGLRF